jgi:hypothetical protein
VESLRIEGTKDLRRVAGSDAFHKVTVYSRVEGPPTERHANELRLRAAFDGAAERLRARGVSDDEIETRMGRLEAVRPSLGSLDPSVRAVAWVGDDQGWAHAPLVDALPERVVVAGEFALRPLLRALERDLGFRMLLVSGNRVATFAGNAGGLRPLPVKNLPESLEDALGSRIEGEGVSYRSDQPVPGRAANAPIYHGHGGAPEEREVDRERFAQAVARAIESAWGGDDVPVVLGAEVRTASELRRHLKLPGLLDEEVRGNLDDAPPDELARLAWSVVRSAVEARQTERASGYERARNVGKSMEGDFDAVGEAAVAGRIRRLWVEEDGRCPGRFDWQTGRREDSPDEADDALDGLVAQVLRRGGEVHVVGSGELPDGGPCCAELR